MKRKIESTAGVAAVQAWKDGPAALPRPTLATAVRFALEEFATLHPGRAVEIRVPPFGAVQALAGTVHRRGTPPAVIETDADTWLALATGRLSWAATQNTPQLQASGERTNLAEYLPFL